MLSPGLYATTTLRVTVQAEASTRCSRADRELHQHAAQRAEVLTMVRSVDEPGWLADLIAFSPEELLEQRPGAAGSSIRSSDCAALSVMIQMRLDVLKLAAAIEAQAGALDRQQRVFPEGTDAGHPEGARRGIGRRNAGR